MARSRTRYTLSALIQRELRRNGLTLSQACRRAGEHGLSLKLHTLLNLRDNPISIYPTPETMEAIAAAFGVQYWDVLESATTSLKRPKIWRVDSTENGTVVAVLSDEELTVDEVQTLGDAIDYAAQQVPEG